MFNDEGLKGFLLLLSCDETIEKIGETSIVDLWEVVWIVPIGVFALTIPGKVDIVFFGAILKFPNQIGELTIIVYEMFPDGFQGFQSE